MTSLDVLQQTQAIFAQVRSSNKDAGFFIAYCLLPIDTGEIWRASDDVPGCCSWCFPHTFQVSNVFGVY